MKKLILVLIIFIPLFVSAQYSNPNRIFGKGQADVKAGIGLFSTYLKDNPRTIVPPLSISADWFVSRNTTLGLEVGYGKFESNNLNTISEDVIKGINTTLVTNLRVGFHYVNTDNLDVYGGFSLGYQHVSMDLDDQSSAKSVDNLGIQETQGSMVYTAFVGTQYAITPKFSIFGELGYGISILKVGFSHNIFQ